MKKILCLNVLCLIAVLFVGCSSVTWKNVSYCTPASTISLPKQSKIKIISMEKNKLQELIVKTLQEEFTKSGQFIIVEDSPDYLISISSKDSYRIDDRGAIEYNQCVYKAVDVNEHSGKDIIKTKTSLSSTATKLVLVSLYKVNNLAPITTFEIIINDSDYDVGTIRSELSYHEKFANETVLKIIDSFLEKNVNILTAFPNNANIEFVAAVKGSDKNRISELKKELIPQEFNEFVAEIKEGKYVENEEEMELKLSNYYVYNVSEEGNTLSVDKLEELYKNNMMILAISKEDGLKEAVPNTLARLEKKINLINGKN